MRPRTAHQRPQDWPERLHAYLHACEATPFAWGTHDCCTIVADWVQILTDADPIAELRGTYATEAEAEAMVAQHGTLIDLMAAHATAAGLQECLPVFAQRGDVAVIMFGNQLVSGIVVGNRVAVPGEDGLRLAPLECAQRVWAIG